MCRDKLVQIYGDDISLEDSGESGEPELNTK